MFNYKMLTLHQQVGQQTLTIHPVIIYNEQELILCDVGFPNQIEQFEVELKKYGFKVQDVTKIVISHQDHDHVGSLLAFRKQNKKIEIISSPNEAPYITGDKKPLRLQQAEEYNKTLKGNDLEFGVQFADYLRTIQHCTIDRVVEDGDYIIQGLRVVATPGHTPGHLSLLLEDANVIIAGDALVFEDNQFGIANLEFTLDMDACIKSIRKLKMMSPNKIICYHGGLVDNHIDALLENI